MKSRLAKHVTAAWVLSGVLLLPLGSAAGGGFAGAAPTSTGVVVDAGPLRMFSDQRAFLALTNLSAAEQVCTLELFDKDGALLAQRSRTVPPGQMGIIGVLITLNGLVRGRASCPLAGAQDLFSLTLEARKGGDVQAMGIDDLYFVDAGQALLCPSTALGDDQSLRINVSNFDAEQETYTIQFLSRTGIVLDTKAITIDPQDASGSTYRAGESPVRAVLYVGGDGGIFRLSTEVVGPAARQVISGNHCTGVE